MKLLSYISKFTFIAYLGFAFSVLAFEGNVVGVSDGDTITVLDINKVQHKVRLAGIDAPEKGQEFGKSSKELLSDLVYGKTVNVPDTKLDRYGRTVSRVLIGGTDVSLEMIKAGMAWHFKKYELEQKFDDRLRYNAAEVMARNAKLGLWSQGTAKRPEDFRSESRLVQTANSNDECPCGANSLCTGSRGGQYCINSNGKKKYTSN
jgi:endonuclease YncB( thermonuclease family)